MRRLYRVESTYVRCTEIDDDGDGSIDMYVRCTEIDGDGDVERDGYDG
jgi:hypothetical protein